MAQAFSFGFRNDDIEIDKAEDAEMQEGQPKVESVEELLPARLHTLGEMISTLPSSISYKLHTISSASDPTTLQLPRRELFDIRAQLMAEDDVSRPDNPLAAGLSSDDIKPGVYEGGFKTWECSVSLARYLLLRCRADGLLGRRRDIHIIELGAGTALPTATLLARFLESPLDPGINPMAAHITVADYNASVLHLATLPNLLLVASDSLSLTSDNKTDLDIFPALTTSISAELSSRNIHLHFLSGAWSPDFVSLASSLSSHQQPTSPPPEQPTPVPTQRPSPDPPLTLVLASETIYAPGSLVAFVDTLASLLQSGRQRRKGRGEALALVAAKKVYFGVGGGVDEFVRRAEGKGMRVEKVWDSDDEGGVGEGRGVGRCILEVRLE